MANGGSCHADTVDAYSARAASCANLRDHAVRLMKRRERHRMRRSCGGQGNGNSDQSDHIYFSTSELTGEPTTRLNRQTEQEEAFAMVIAFLSARRSFDPIGFVFAHRPLNIGGILQRLDVDLGHLHHGGHHLGAVGAGHEIGQSRIVDLPRQSEAILQPPAGIVTAPVAQRGP